MLPQFTAKIAAVSYGSLPQGNFVYIEFVSVERLTSNPVTKQQVSNGFQVMIHVIPFPPLEMKRVLRMELHLTEEEYSSLPTRFTVGDYFDFSFNEKGALLIQPESRG